MYMRSAREALPLLASRGTKKCMFFGPSGRGPTTLFILDLINRKFGPMPKNAQILAFS